MPLTRQQKKDLNITDLEAYTMASEEAIDAKLEAFGNRMEEKMRSLFAEFSIGQLSNPRKSQHGETSNRRDDPQAHGHITSDLNNPRMKVDFPRWEEGDPIGWISRAERCFRSYRTANATRVEIAVIHLEGDVIQWFNWFKHTHGGLSWQRFKEGLLDRFGPTNFNNIDGQLAKIRQTSTIQEYQTRFKRLSNQTENWSEKQLSGTFIEGLKPEIREEVKARQPYTLMATISFAHIQEEQLNHEVRRTRVAPRPTMSRSTAPSTVIQAPAPKKLTRDELRERSAKELCWHYDEPWSREHHCQKGRLLIVEPAENEDNETSEEALEPKEEAMEEESQPANYALILQVSHLK
ncbi:hypothetical protein GW17_00003069 [Ensete ventricosum]|nr:hypothetical protein GW17_00003069 [Ensete ventricosum]